VELHPKERVLFGLESREEVLIERSSCVRLHIPEVSEQSVLLEVLFSDCEVMVEINNSFAVLEMVFQILRNTTVENTVGLDLDCVSDCHFPVDWRNSSCIVSTCKVGE